MRAERTPLKFSGVSSSTELRSFHWGSAPSVPSACWQSTAAIDSFQSRLKNR